MYKFLNICYFKMFLLTLNLSEICWYTASDFEDNIFCMTMESSLYWSFNQFKANVSMSQKVC